MERMKIIIAMFLAIQLNAMAQDSDDGFTYKTEWVVDVDSLTHACQKAEAYLTHRTEEREMLHTVISEMLSRGKASTEQQQELLKQAFSVYVAKGGGTQRKSSLGWSVMASALGSNGNITYTSTKLQKKVGKDVEKRKVHEELRSILKEMSTMSPEEKSIETQVSNLSVALETLAHTQSGQEKTDVEQQLKTDVETGNYNLIVQDMPLKTVKIPEGLKDRSQFYMTIDGNRIPNRNSWLWFWFNYEEWKSLLIANMTKGWEWANDEDKLVKKYEHYPNSVEFYMSPEHPEYAVIEGAIYDKNGKLLRVTSCSQADYYSIKWDIIKRDYLANKYEIKSAPKKTQDYLKKQLGLSAPTAEDMKRYKKMGNEYKEAFAANMKETFAVTKKEKRAAKADAHRKGMKFAASLFDELFDYDTEGDKFIKQICQDHRHDLRINYYVERIDELSFIVKYINCGNTGEIYTTKVWYTQDGKFAKKKHSELIDVEKVDIVIDDFIDPEIAKPMHSLSNLRDTQSL